MARQSFKGIMILCCNKKNFKDYIIQLQHGNLIVEETQKLRTLRLSSISRTINCLQLMTLKTIEMC